MENKVVPVPLVLVAKKVIKELRVMKDGQD